MQLKPHTKQIHSFLRTPISYLIYFFALHQQQTVGWICVKSAKIHKDLRKNSFEDATEAW